MDEFLKKNNRVEQCTLKLVGIAAVVIAVKVNEDKLLSMASAAYECQGEYDVDMIIKTERIILALLDFKVDLPTAFDFISFFLYITDATFDFSDVIEECLNFIYVSMIGKSNTDNNNWED